MHETAENSPQTHPAITHDRQLGHWRRTVILQWLPNGTDQLYQKTQRILLNLYNEIIQQRTTCTFQFDFIFHQFLSVVIVKQSVQLNTCMMLHVVLHESVEWDGVVLYQNCSDRVYCLPNSRLCISTEHTLTVRQGKKIFIFIFS